MALSPKERAMIRRLVDRQIQLEQMIANRMGLLPGLAYRASLEDPFDSPLVFSREDKISIAEDGVRRGKKLRSKIKKPRKVSAYQKQFGRELKNLKKKHPRTPINRLMKKAHSATKKVMRK